jgi:hypothetical protein
VGYGDPIRSELRLCKELHFNWVYRGVLPVGLEVKVPGRSAWPDNGQRRFRGGSAFRWVSEPWPRDWSAMRTVRWM